MPLLLDLLLTFMKVGFFTFGGGYAMISVIEDICVEKKKWITHEEMMQMTIIATAGMVIPSFLVIYLIASVLTNFLEIALVAKAMKGIKVGVGLLILSVGLNMVKKMQKKPFPKAICGCAFGFMVLNNLLGLGISTITLMIVAGTAGYLFFRFQKGGDRK